MFLSSTPVNLESLALGIYKFIDRSYFALALDICFGESVRHRPLDTNECVDNDWSSVR